MNMMKLDLAGPVQELIAGFIAALPTLLSFVAVVTVGLVVAPIAASVVRTLVRKSGLETLLERVGAPRLLYRVGYKHGTASLLATVAKLAIWLATALIASDIAGLRQISQGLDVIIGYLPQVAVAIFFLMIGMWAADIARGVFSGVSRKNSSTSVIGTAIYYGVIAITVALVADQLGLKTQLINNIILLALGAGALSAALGAGLSARPTLSNLLARNYIAQLYPRGDRIQMGDVKGIVRSHAPTVLVVVDEEDRTWNIPYVRLMESVVETSGTPRPIAPEATRTPSEPSDDAAEA